MKACRIGEPILTCVQNPVDAIGFLEEMYMHQYKSFIVEWELMDEYKKLAENGSFDV